MERMNNKRAELIAIYRLEFYKKQKSWKLTKDAKHEKYARNDHILNKTYDIEKPSTLSGFLNDAMIDTVSDNSNTQPSSAAITMEPEIKTECSSTNNPYFQNDQLGYSHPWIHPVLKLQSTELENAFTPEYGDQDLLEFHCYPGEFQTDYLLDSNENLMHKSTLDQLLCKDYQMIPGLDCGDNASNVCCTENMFRDECLLLPDEADLRWINENSERSGLSDLSTDSWLDFMRGADMAPHSSNVELTLPNALSELEVSGDELARLSSVQLKQAVRAHTQLLRQLLREETHRRRLRSCLSLTGSAIERPQFSPRPATELCTYEQPTRDFGPFCYSDTRVNELRRDTFNISEDTFVAGSHRREVELMGRGRGRMLKSKFDPGDRIVGKGRGRSFRLA